MLFSFSLKQREVLVLQNVVPNLYVVGMGLGVVFVGLIAIIILCYIIGAICTAGQKAPKTDNTADVLPQPATAPTVIENRGEIIAAVSAAVAEELGTDVSAIRILSFKKI